VLSFREMRMFNRYSLAESKKLLIRFSEA